MKRPASKNISLILLVALFACSGVLLVVRSKASTVAPSFEAESGVLASSARTVNDTSASASQAVLFVQSGTASTLCSGMSNWSNPATWGGTVPVANANVTLPAGSQIKVDVDVPHFGTVTIPSGTTLCFPDRATTFSAKQIAVMGNLQAGTTVQPLTNNVTFKLEGGVPTDSYLLTGQASTDIDAYNAKNGGMCDAPAPTTCIHLGKDIGTNFLAAMNGGKIDLHGKNEGRSWTDLASTSAAGSSTLSLRAAVGWQPGDVLILASTDYNWHNQEYVTVQSVSADGKTITLASPLAHKHVGISTCQTSGTETRCVDERAEVGLLTHNIKITGPSDAATTGFGGQNVILPGGSINVDNTEYYAMGQKAKMGRYPLHLHILGDGGQNSVVNNISLHDNFNRQLDFHGTNKAHVTGMVAVNTIGHAVMFEDSNESRNVLTNNLVGGAALNETESERLRRSDEAPADYWITNVDNDLIGNHAMGSDGVGFWWDFSDNDNLWVRSFDAFTGTVNDNVAHSTMCTSVCRAGATNAGHEGGDGFFVDRYNGNSYTAKYLNRNTTYKNEGFGVWVDGGLGSVVFADTMIADTLYAVTTQGAYMKGGFFTFTTANSAGDFPRQEDPTGYGGGLLRTYHGGSDYDDIWLAGYGGTTNTALYSAITDIGVGISDHPLRLKNIKFFGPGYKVLYDACKDTDTSGQVVWGACYWGYLHVGNSHVLYDLDGSIRGDGTPIAVTNAEAFMRYGNTWLATNVQVPAYGTTNRGMVIPASYLYNQLSVHGQTNGTQKRDSDGAIGDTSTWSMAKLGERYFYDGNPTEFEYGGLFGGTVEVYMNRATAPREVNRHIYDNGGNGGDYPQPKASSLANLGVDGTWWYGNGKLYIHMENTGTTPFGYQNITYRETDSHNFGTGYWWTIKN